MPTACHQVPNITTQAPTNITTQAPSQQELEELYKDLSLATDRKPAILSLISPYSDSFTQSSDHLPPLLQCLYEPENLHLNYLHLITKFKDICKQPITAAQVNHLEELTRGQAKNRQWFKYRVGRITASKLYKVWL